MIAVEAVYNIALTVEQMGEAVTVEQLKQQPYYSKHPEFLAAMLRFHHISDDRAQTVKLLPICYNLMDVLWWSNSPLKSIDLPSHVPEIGDKYITVKHIGTDIYVITFQITTKGVANDKPNT